MKKKQYISPAMTVYTTASVENLLSGSVPLNNQQATPGYQGSKGYNTYEGDFDDVAE